MSRDPKRSVTANLEDPQLRNYEPVVSKLPACNFEATGLFYATYPLFSYYFFLVSKLCFTIFIRFEVTNRQFRIYEPVVSKLPVSSFEATGSQFRHYEPVASKLSAGSFETKVQQFRHYGSVASKLQLQIRNYCPVASKLRSQFRNHWPLDWILKVNNRKYGFLLLNVVVDSFIISCH